jgi:plasmid stabilization system protein ParE
MANYELRLRTKALADVRRIRVWYQKIDDSLEEQFLTALNARLDRIQSNPLMYQVINRNTRRAMLQNFPYSVFSVVQDTRVIVVGVLHHKRNPELAESISE